MTIPLTTRILGYLIEKGYTYILAKSVENETDGTVTISLFTSFKKPEFTLAGSIMILLSYYPRAYANGLRY